MTGTLTALFAAIALFVGGHFILSSRPIRTPLVGHIGERVFAGLYSFLMLLIFIWIIAAYRVAPPFIVWDLGPRVNWIPIVIMPFALILAVAGLAPSNPTGVIATIKKPQSLTPRGMQTITRHPFLCGVALWGISHLIANGDAASILLFGGMVCLAVAGMFAIDRKRATKLGAAWAPFAAQTSRMPFAAVLSGRTRLDFTGMGWPIAFALALYVVLIFSHDWLFGVPVLAPAGA